MEPHEGCPIMSIKIVGKDDPTPIKENDPDWDPRNLSRGYIRDAIILQNGMTSGKTSVAFLMKGNDGKNYFIETSAAIIQNLAACIAGADMKWADEKTKNN